MIEGASVFTEKGFVRIKDLPENAKILQYNLENREASFVTPEIEIIPYKGELLQLGGGARKSGMVVMHHSNKIPTMRTANNQKWIENLLLDSSLDIDITKLGTIQAGMGVGSIKSPLPIDILYLASTLFGTFENGIYTVTDAKKEFTELILETLDNTNIPYKCVDTIKKVIKFRSSDLNSLDIKSLGFADRSYEWAEAMFKLLNENCGNKRLTNITYSLDSRDPVFIDWFIGICTLGNRRMELVTTIENISKFTGTKRHYQVDVFNTAAGTLYNMKTRDIKFDGNLARIVTPSGYYFVRYNNQISVVEPINVN